MSPLVKILFLLRLYGPGIPQEHFELCQAASETSEARRLCGWTYAHEERLTCLVHCGSWGVCSLAFDVARAHATWDIPRKRRLQDEIARLMSENACDMN